jgi:hypothetical protein
MNNVLNIKNIIETTLKSVKLGVLATEKNGQPHTSLVAITPIGNFSQLIFGTYRNTMKYQNFKQNDKVALLLNGINTLNSSGAILTAIGTAEEIISQEKEQYLKEHIARHPELVDFLKSLDCALVCIKVQSYQVVCGINEIFWWSIEEQNN